MPRKNFIAPTRRFWESAMVIAAIAAVYAPALTGGYVWDDDRHVTAPPLRSLSGLARIWSRPGATAQYYPFLHTAFWLEHRLWGDAALGYHLVNVGLHAAAALLLIAVLRRLAVPGAFFAGLLFAVHPVCVESVAWISEQKNTLSAVFYLLAALLWVGTPLRGVRLRPMNDPWDSQASQADASKRRPYLSLLCFVLALGTKSVTATLPVALLVIAWWRKGSLSWREDVRPLLPWFALALADGLFTAWVERHYIGASGPAFAFSTLARILIAGRALCFYVGKLAWPAHLSFIYPRWTIDAHAAVQYLYPLLTGAAFALAWACRRQNRGPAAALLFYAVSLAPALGFVNIYPFVFSFVADHFQYIAAAGAFAMAAAAIVRILGRIQASVVLSSGCVLFGILSWRASAKYHNAETLYRSTLAANPGCWMAENNLAIVLENSGRTAEAIAHLQRAIALHADYPTAEFNFGNALRISGQFNAAIVHYRKALQEQPAFPEAENNLGVSLVATGAANEGALAYSEALRLKPDYPEALIGLSTACLVAGRISDAIAAGQDAVRASPSDERARLCLANAYVHAGRLAEAETQLRRAVEIRPDFTAARQNLQAVDHALGRAIVGPTP